MNHEDIKRNWQMLNRKVDELEDRVRRLASIPAITRSQTLQQRLCRRFRWQAILGFMLPLISPFNIYIGLPLWVAVAYAVIGVALGGCNLWLSRFISARDYTQLPLVESMAHAVKVLRMMLLLKRAGYLLLVLFMTPLLYEIWKLGEPEVFYSACCGGVVGVIIGLVRERENNRLARQMVKTLENDINQ